MLCWGISFSRLEQTNWYFFGNAGHCGSLDAGSSLNRALEGNEMVDASIILNDGNVFQNSEGSWIGALIEKATHFFFYHMNYYTAILVKLFCNFKSSLHEWRKYFQLCFTVWFVYHVDINDDLLWWRWYWLQITDGKIQT